MTLNDLSSLTFENRKQELIQFSKKIVFAAFSSYNEGNLQTEKNIFYLYYPGGNEWLDSLTDDSLREIDNSIFKIILLINHNNNVNDERKNYLSMRVVSLLWPKVFNRQRYLCVDNTRFIGVNTGVLCIEFFTLAESNKYIAKRPNASDIIV